MTQLAREYGEALFELAKEERLLDRLDDEIAALDRIFQEEKGYISLLSSHALPQEERLRILDESIGEAHPYLVNFTKLLLQRGALSYFHECAKYFHLKSMEAQGVVEATVTSAEPLAPSLLLACSSAVIARSARYWSISASLLPAAGSRSLSAVLALSSVSMR